MRPPLPRRALAEFCGTAFLVAVVVGSGIAAQRLSPNDTGLQLFENAAATAGGLVALILAFGPVSGAHFNPVVSLADAFFGGLDRRELPAYLGAQIAGAITGSIIANPRASPTRRSRSAARSATRSPESIRRRCPGS